MVRHPESQGVWWAATNVDFWTDARILGKDSYLIKFYDFRHLPLASFAIVLPLLILEPELLIRWNHIEGVGTIRSTGQLIPLVVAISGLVIVLYKMVERKDAREWVKNVLYKMATGRRLGKEPGRRTHRS